MCNSYTRYNLNPCMYVILIIFNCTMHMQMLNTSEYNMCSLKREKGKKY